MVNPDEFKRKIKEIVSQDYHLEFLGDSFDQIVRLLTDIKADKMYQWIKEVVDESIRPIVIATKKPYKNWMIKRRT